MSAEDNKGITRRLERVSKRILEIANADEGAAQKQKGLVDVCSPLVAYAKAPATGKPCQR
jgi:hypothetical protein